MSSCCCCFWLLLAPLSGPAPPPAPALLRAAGPGRRCTGRAPGRYAAAHMHVWARMGRLLDATQFRKNPTSLVLGGCAVVPSRGPRADGFSSRPVQPRNPSGKRRHCSGQAHPQRVAARLARHVGQPAVHGELQREGWEAEGMQLKRMLPCAVGSHPAIHCELRGRWSSHRCKVVNLSWRQQHTS